MKRFAMLVLCVVFILSFGVLVQARAPIRAHVPFAFSVGSTELPAGTYGIYEQGGMLCIVGKATRLRVVAATFGSERKIEESGTVQFVSRDGKHYLAKVYAPGLGTGRELFMKN